VDRLAWLKVPRNSDREAPLAEIRPAKGETYSGRVVRLLGDLSEQGRMARLLVEVSDPLGLRSEEGTRTPLLLGQYVQVSIQGKELADVYTIPRTALRENQSIWIATPDDTLEIREIIPLWRDAEKVYLKEGVSVDEQVILSDLAGPVMNMPLQVTEVDGKKTGSQAKDTAPAQDLRGRLAFQKMDLNNDGLISIEELSQSSFERGTPEQIMEHLDRDGDNRISPREFSSRKSDRPGGEG
jgi:hypothetical protein